MASFRLALAAAAIAIATPSLAQQGYPNKPIKMIIPLAAASAVDNAARIVTQKMSANMGQQIVVENIPGAAGLIGAKNVASAGFISRKPKRTMRIETSTAMTENTARLRAHEARLDTGSD